MQDDENLDIVLPAVTMLEGIDQVVYLVQERWDLLGFIFGEAKALGKLVDLFLEGGPIGLLEVRQKQGQIEFHQHQYYDVEFAVDVVLGKPVFHSVTVYFLNQGFEVVGVQIGHLVKYQAVQEEAGLYCELLLDQHQKQPI